MKNLVLTLVIMCLANSLFSAEPDIKKPIYLTFTLNGSEKTWVYIQRNVNKENFIFVDPGAGRYKYKVLQSKDNIQTIKIIEMLGAPVNLKGVIIHPNSIIGKTFEFKMNMDERNISITEITPST
jgi:hypothetical protein